MKQTFTPAKTAAALLISCSFLLHQNVQARPHTAGSAVPVPSNEEPKDKKPEKKAKAAKFASRNNDAVKIYPDIIKREMHVVAKDNEGQEITFFVFDLQGSLLHQYKMKSKDHYRITGLKKGTYVYRVFNGDEETATGQFEIR